MKLGFSISIVKVILFSMTAFSGCASIDTMASDQCAMTVNGHCVTLQEFSWFMQQGRASVIRAVNAASRRDFGENFWEQDYAGSSPKKMLSQQTIDKVIREKVQQDLFVELDLIRDIRFSAFLDNLEKLNQERKQIVEQKGVIYGPIQYTPLQYYGHWMATMQTQAKAKLRKERFEVTESKIRDYYRRNKDQFKTAESFTLETLTIGSEEASGSQHRRDALESLADEVFLKVQQGQVLELTALEYAARNDFSVLYRKYEQIHDDRLDELFPDRTHFNAIRPLTPGQVVRLSGSENEIWIVKCISKTLSDGLPYEQIRDILADRYVDSEYDRLIESRIKNAQVEINREIIDSIQIP